MKTLKIKIPDKIYYQLKGVASNLDLSFIKTVGLMFAVFIYIARQHSCGNTLAILDKKDNIKSLVKLETL